VKAPLKSHPAIEDEAYRGILPVPAPLWDEELKVGSCVRGSIWLARQSLRPSATHACVVRCRRRACIVVADKALALPEKPYRVSLTALPRFLKLRCAASSCFPCEEAAPKQGSLKTDASLVRGCTSIVHVIVKLDAQGPVNIEADSDAQLTKELVALRVYGFDGYSLGQILAVDPAFIVASGLSVSLTPSRNNGFVNMVALVKPSLTELKDDAQSGSAAGEEKMMLRWTNSLRDRCTRQYCARCVL
jgi:sulfur transfer protein SufE